MPNRLARERSPYLLQHANNPVDWYPWGDEAFAAPRREDKPIFLSIGYSTCHWCHVMEHESFEDAARRGRAESRFRLDQGRSRGAAGRRSRVHDVRAGDDRRRRLADERVADAGSASRSSAARTFRRRRAGAGRDSSTCSRSSRARGGTSAAASRPVRRRHRRAAARGDRRRRGRAGSRARRRPRRHRRRHRGVRAGVRSRATAALAARRSFRGRPSCCSSRTPTR